MSICDETKKTVKIEIATNQQPKSKSIVSKIE